MELLLNFLFIFLSRIVDVSLGTVRIILVSKGMKIQSSVLGFFEVLIWIVVVAQVIKYVSSPIYYVAFAAGFACGNFIGMTIENKIALGSVIVRIITRMEAFLLVDTLRKEKFAVTSIDAKGKDGAVKVIFGIIRRKDLKKFIKIVNHYNPMAFYTIEDVREVRTYYKDPILTHKPFFFNVKRK